MNACDKVEAHTEAFATTLIRLCEDAHHLEPTDDALDLHRLARGKAREERIVLCLTD